MCSSIQGHGFIAGRWRRYKLAPVALPTGAQGTIGMGFGVQRGWRWSRGLGSRWAAGMLGELGREGSNSGGHGWPVVIVTPCRGEQGGNGEKSRGSWGWCVSSGELGRVGERRKTMSDAVCMRGVRPLLACCVVTTGIGCSSDLTDDNSCLVGVCVFK